MCLKSKNLGDFVNVCSTPTRKGKVKMRRKRSCKPGKFRLKREMSLSLRVSGLDLVIVLVVLKILDHFLTM